jgi:antagonist of KipI
MTLVVLDPGLYSLVVDLGRTRGRSLGVPVGGAADRAALTVGNGLVGNPPGAAALEVCLAGPTLRAECDCACVVHGAPFELSCDRGRLRAGTTFTLRAGETLRVGGAARQMRAYLCVRGGLLGPAVLGSRSALAPVRAGDRLACQPGVIHGRFARIEWNGDRDPSELRCLAGAQADWFDPGALERVAFAVSAASNRMGLRLDGPPLAVPARELVSEPVCPGSVQVTRDGQCIVLGVDGQTIGGYPKIAQVISADLDRLGQLRPGDPVRFRTVGLDEAEALYHRRLTELREWTTRLRTAELFACTVAAARPSEEPPLPSE